MLALWALALWNIRLVSAVPSTVTVNDQDPRIQYTPAQQWFVLLFNIPRHYTHTLSGFMTPPKTGGAIPTTDHTPGRTAPRQSSSSQVAPIASLSKKGSETGTCCIGIGINITGPTGPDQALRMILLNNVSMGTCEPETADNEPATSFFSKLLDYGHYIVEVRHVDTRPNRTLTIEAFRSVVSLERNVQLWQKLILNLLL